MIKIARQFFIFVLLYVMNNFGFIRTAACSVSSAALHCDVNADKIIGLVQRAEDAGAAIVLFQELSVTAATCGDLFFNKKLLDDARNAVVKITEATKNLEVLVSVGFPMALENKLYSVHALCHRGKIIALVPIQSDLKNFSHFSTGVINVKNFFALDYDIPFGNFSFELIFSLSNNIKHCTVSFVNACADASNTNTNTDIILIPYAKASYAHTDHTTRIKNFSYAQTAILVCANAGSAESSGENIFLGECGIYECGKTLAEGNIFSNTESKSAHEKKFPCMDLDRSPFAISDCDIQLIQNKKLKAQRGTSAENFCEKNMLSITLKNAPQKNLLYTIEKFPYMPDLQNDTETRKFFTRILDYTALALARRLQAVHTEKLILGISGGIDSTFALLVCVRCMILLQKNCKNIFSFTIPCFGTSERTKNNAIELAENLNCTVQTIDITQSVLQHFSDIAQDYNKRDVCFENAQARERTQVLMDKANQLGGIVVSASDLSEIALGWSTFAGDSISMYNLASSLPKTVLRHALHFYAYTPEHFASADGKIFTKIVLDILDTPISPELLPTNADNSIAQKTEHILGAYELHDFFLFHFIQNNFSKEKILFLAECAFTDQYDRATIEKTLETFFKRFMRSQFKRSVAPEGASVLPLSLSPRGSWLMPSDLIF